MTHSLIVKIQRPLESSEPLEQTPWLVKTQDGRFCMMCKPPADMVEAMGDRVKIYARVALEGDPVVILEVLPDQPW